MLQGPDVAEALRLIYPLIPFAIQRMQTDVSPLVFADLEGHTKASIVHNIAMREGERRFSDETGINFTTARGLMYFELPKVLVRVKHAERNTLRIATNNTQQTMQWIGQLPLTGVADPRDHLHLVYVPDPLWSKVDRSVVGYYKGNDIQDSREIDVDDWYAAAPSLITPIATTDELPPLKLKPGIVAMPLEELDGTQ